MIPIPPAVLQQPVPAPPEDLSGRVTTLTEAKRWDALADLLEGASPVQRGRWLTQWVEALYKAGRFERVLGVAEAALPQLKPGDTRLMPLRLHRAQAYSHLNRHAEAGLAWEQFGENIGLENAFVEFRMVQDWPSCERVARLSLAKAADPAGKAKAQGLLGEALARQDRFSEAEAPLKSAADAGSREPFVWSNLGRCCNARKAWADALAACDQALTLDPALGEAHFNRGRAAFELGRYLESEADFRAALAQDPSNPTFQENLRQASRYAHPQGKAHKAKG